MAAKKQATAADGGKEIEALAADFLQGQPASGFYRAPPEGYSKKFAAVKFPDGNFAKDGWTFRFEGGRFIKATRDDRNPDLPKAGQKAAADV